MPKNLIVLTGGQSGSSVLTALIARAGYWLGDETKKKSYDTYENARLVDLNREILQASDNEWEQLVANPSPEAVQRIRDAVSKIDARAPRDFIEECAAHQPWIWKDPRLCYTMHFWESYLDLSECLFVVMGRDSRQAWTGHMVKGKRPISLRDYTTIYGGLAATAEAYVVERGLSYVLTSFEELTVEPARAVGRLNDFLGTSLTLNDLAETYKGPLGRARWSRRDYVEAWLRYQYHRWIRRDTLPFGEGN